MKKARIAMLWILRWAIIIFLFSATGCDGELENPDPRLRCGGWQENPALLGTWESVDFPPAARFELTEESIRFGDSPQTFAYAVCYRGDENLLIVNDIELSYHLSGESLQLDGRIYVRR